MKNKKGFTLIELIVTIALLGIIGTVVAVNMIGVKKQQDKKEENRVNAIIRACAETYIKTNDYNNKCVPIKDLIDDGCLKESYVNKYINDFVMIDENGEYKIVKKGESDLCDKSDSLTNEYKIIYKQNLENEKVNGIPNDTKRYKADQEIEITANPTTKGYVFNGWTRSKKDNGEYVTKVKMAKGGITLYAQWQKRSFTLSYNPPSITQNGFYKDNLIVKADDAFKEGYKFEGWKNKDNKYFKGDTIELLEDTILEAQFTPNIYEINLDNQNATSSETNKIYEKFDNNFYLDKETNKQISKITIPVKTGYTFKGYFTNQNNQGDKVIDEQGNIIVNNNYIKTNTTLYASWEKNTYKVDIKVTNAAKKAPEITSVRYNEDIVQEFIPNSGYDLESYSCTGQANLASKLEQNKLTIQNIKSDISCTVTYKQFYYKVEVAANKGTLYNALNLKDAILQNKVLENADITKASVTQSYYDSTSKRSNIVVENGLYKEQFTDGTVYYFRGAVDNNYIKFANLLWRIVKINSDGSVKLILNQSLKESDMDNYYINHYINDNNQAYNDLNSFYNNYLNQYAKYIVDNPFCVAKFWTTNSASGLKSQNNCNEYCYLNNNERFSDCKISVSSNLDTNQISNPIGLLTPLEAIYAGIYYSFNSTVTSSSYLNNNTSWYTMASSNGSSSSSIYISNNNLKLADYYTKANIRPVISIKGSQMVKGKGTNNDPYVLVDVDSSIKSENSKNIRKGENADFNITPAYNSTYKSVSCTNNQSGSYNQDTSKLTVSNVSHDTKCTIDFLETKYLAIYVLNNDKTKYESYIDKLINEFKQKGINLKIDLIPYGSYKIKKYQLNTNKPESGVEFGRRMSFFLGIIDKYALFVDRVLSPHGSTHADGEDKIYYRRYNDTYEEPTGILCSIRKSNSLVNSYKVSTKYNSLFARSAYLTSDDKCYIERGYLSTSYEPEKVELEEYKDMPTSLRLQSTFLHDPYFNTNNCNSAELNYLKSNINNYLAQIDGRWYIYNKVVSDGNKCGYIVQNEKDREDYLTYSLWYDETASGDGNNVLTYQKDSDNFSNKYRLIINKNSNSYYDNNEYVFKDFKNKTINQSGDNIIEYNTLKNNIDSLLQN